MKKQKKIFYILIVAVLMMLSFSFGNMHVARSDQTFTEKDNKKIQTLKSMIDDQFLFDIDDKKLQDGAYKGMIRGLDDPYSEYLTKEDYEAMKKQTDGEYSGVGLVVTAADDGYITVISTIKGTPADKAGIKTGDQIIAINDQVFHAQNLSDAVEIMRGKAGTKVTLKIRRIENKKPNIFDKQLKRENIELATVESKQIDQLGYIRITQFGTRTADEFNTAYDQLKEKKVKGIILDLRNNPGGTLDATVTIADRLLPEGPIIKMVNKKGEEHIEKSEKSEENIPMVVLINGGSASASEVLTGAIRDYKKATIVGEKSFGKGIVQQLFPLNDGTALKLTVSEYFTPKGTKIHKKGIQPDIEVPLDPAVKVIGIENIEQDNQLQKAIELLK